MALKDIFETTARFFEKESIDYAVIGAFALYGFGYVRATRDIDFVARIASQKKIRRYLETLGFETTHCSTAFSNHVHPIGAMRVDILYVQGVTADEIFAHVQKRVLFRGRAYPVVAPEHLVAMKLFAASQSPERKLRDLADIRALLENATVDRDMVKTLFTRYGLEKYYDDTAR